MLKKNSKIYLAGHSGLVGSSIHRLLKSKGYTNIIVRSSSQLDLRESRNVDIFFQDEKPEFVIIAAAKVGGIMANNTFRADFIYDNLMIQSNIIYSAYKYNIKKLVFLGSTCIYPKNAAQPIKEDSLLTDSLEYTNEPYAIAKIAGIKLCESFNIQYGTNFISLMPTNIYGPYDNFDLKTSHVLPALLRKIFLGKCLEDNNFELIRKDLIKRPLEDLPSNPSEESIIGSLRQFGITIIKSDSGNKPEVEITIWGTGKPMREFLWSDDLAEAAVFSLKSINFEDTITDKSEIRNTHLNIGTGKDISIKKLAELIKEKAGFKGRFRFDTSKPDGTFKKTISVEKIHSRGWTHKVELPEGIELLLEWYKNSLND